MLGWNETAWAAFTKIDGEIFGESSPDKLKKYIKNR
jgi:hypothetical protein